MSTVKVKFRHSSVEGSSGSIVYAITHLRRVSIVTTEYKIYPEEWDAEHSHIIIGVNPSRKALCHSIQQRVEWDVVSIRRIIERLATTGKGFTAQEVATQFQLQNKQQWFFKFTSAVIVRLKHLGQHGIWASDSKR